MINTENQKVYFKNYFKAFDELKKLGITQNKKDFTS